MPNSRVPPHERLVKNEVVAETLKSDIRELKQKLESLDDEVTGLTVSQRIQLNDLDNIKKSLYSLESTIKTMTTTVVKAETARELDNDINKTLSGLTIKKIQSYFLIGVTIAGILWTVYGFITQSMKPDSHLIDGVHESQRKAEELKEQHK